MFYSKEKHGFYSIEMHGDSIPGDAVEITEETWKALLEGQVNGKEIVAGDDGYPVLRDRPVVEPKIYTPQEKLANLGLSVEDLKALLA
jgi:hypothetical protein